MNNSNIITHSSHKKDSINVDGKDEFKILHLNCQSIRNKIDELEIHLISDANFSAVDVMCITEHWLREQELPMVYLDDYLCTSAFCRINLEQGGVLTLVHKNLEQKEKTHTLYLNEEKKFEHTVIEVKKGTNLYIIVTLYRTPDSSIEIFLSKLDILLDSFKNDKKRCNV